MTVQYSRGRNASISISRSTIRRSATDCTRPAERDPGTAAARNETAAQALQRARAHALRAVGEALAAAQAIVDAASIGVAGRKDAAHPVLRGLSELLDEQSRRLREDGSQVPVPVMTAILDALDQEIARWEKRAERDAALHGLLSAFEAESGVPLLAEADLAPRGEPPVRGAFEAVQLFERSELDVLVLDDRVLER